MVAFATRVLADTVSHCTSNCMPCIDALYQAHQQALVHSISPHQTQPQPSARISLTPVPRPTLKLFTRGIGVNCYRFSRNHPCRMSTPKDPKDEAQAKAEAQAAHYALLEELDIHSIHKSFRNPGWKPNQRRNKNIKAILGESSRREANANSAAATPLDNVSGIATPNTTSNAAGTHTNNDDGLSTSGASTPANGGSLAGAGAAPNLAQASRSLSKLVLEKSLRPGTTTGGLAPGGAGAPSATYTNIESAPSLAPQRRYCDVTGLPAPYQDPKTRLRYHNAEVFGLIRSLPQGYAEQYLEARGAHTVLK